MKYIKAFFIVFAGLLSFIPLESHAASPGNVTLNGEQVNPLWFDIARYAIKRESDYCVVENEDWVREYVIMYLLMQQKIHPDIFVFKPIQSDRPNTGPFVNNQIFKVAQNPATLKVSGLMMRSNRKSYLKRLTEELSPVSASSVRKYYVKLKSENHPAIVDAVYVKRRQLSVPKGEQADAVEIRLAKGDDFMDLYAEFDPVFNHAIEGKHWYLVLKRSSMPASSMNLGNLQSIYPDWNRNVRNGEVLGPYENQVGSVSYIQIVGKVYKELVSLNRGLPGQPNYIKDWIRKRLESKRLPQTKKLLREKATVLVDSKLVHADESSFNCGRYDKPYIIH